MGMSVARLDVSNAMHTLHSSSWCLQASLRDERADFRSQQKAAIEAADLSTAEIFKLRAALDEASGRLVNVEQQSVGTAAQKDQAIRNLERKLRDAYAQSEGRAEAAEVAVADRDSEIAELQEALHVKPPLLARALPTMPGPSMFRHLYK